MSGLSERFLSGIMIRSSSSSDIYSSCDMI